MQDNIFSVSHTKEVNLASGETISNIYVRVYTTMFTSGLVAKMGANRFTTLMALASYMDEKGECYPTQNQIADAIGVHKNTVNRYINDLLEFQIEGKNLVTRQKINKGQGKIFSYYKIHPLSQLAKFNGKIESLESTQSSDIEDTQSEDSLITNKGTTNSAEIRSNNNHLNNTNNTDVLISNSNQAIKHFQEIYREVYNVNYTVSNYGREGKLMKDKVLTPYPELAKEIIETGIRLYDEKFANAKFPRPTISMFSWAVNQIIPMVAEQKEVTEQAEQADDLAEQAELDMLAKLAKLGGN